MTGPLAAHAQDCPWCEAERGAAGGRSGPSRVCDEHRVRLQAEARALVLAERRVSSPAAE